MISKKKKKQKQTSNIKTILGVIFFVSSMLYFTRMFLIYQPILDYFPTKTTVGRIIDEKNYMRRSHFTGRFSYSYAFEINDKIYQNDSYDEKYQINDTVLVEYKGVEVVEKNELLENIGKVHTTEMGMTRIQKNLKLDVVDVVEFCKNKILDSRALIYKQGKNWYCEVNKMKLTINSHSYTIITAHLIK